MPTLPVYIRVDDLDKWKSLPNKSEFIHNALNSGSRRLVVDEPSQETQVKRSPALAVGQTKPIKTKQDAVKVINEVFPDAKPITYKKTGNWGA